MCTICGGPCVYDYFDNMVNPPVVQSTPFKKEPVMNTYNQIELIQATDTDLMKQRNYLVDRAWDVYRKNDKKLGEQFFVFDDEAPKTEADLKDRLAKGMFTLDKYDDEEEDGCYFSPRDWFFRMHWRNPANKKDCDGYYKAVEVLKLAYTQVRDAIAINDPKEGLLAVQSFEAWEYKPSA